MTCELRLPHAERGKNVVLNIPRDAPAGKAIARSSSMIVLQIDVIGTMVVHLKVIRQFLETVTGSFLSPFSS